MWWHGNVYNGTHHLTQGIYIPIMLYYWESMGNNYYQNREGKSYPQPCIYLFDNILKFHSLYSPTVKICFGVMCFTGKIKAPYYSFTSIAHFDRNDEEFIYTWRIDSRILLYSNYCIEYNRCGAKSEHIALEALIPLTVEPPNFWSWYKIKISDGRYKVTWMIILYETIYGVYWILLFNNLSIRAFFNQQSCNAVSPLL